MIREVLALYLCLTALLNFFTWTFFSFQIGFITPVGIYKIKFRSSNPLSGITSVDIGDLKITYNPLKLLYLLVGNDTLTVQLDNVTIYLNSRGQSKDVTSPSNDDQTGTENNSQQCQSIDIQRLFEEKVTEITLKLYRYAGFLLPLNFQINNIILNQQDQDTFQGQSIRLIVSSKKEDAAKESISVTSIVLIDEFKVYEHKFLGHLICTTSLEFCEPTKEVFLFCDFYSKDIDINLDKAKAMLNNLLPRKLPSNQSSKKMQCEKNIEPASLIDEKFNTISYIMDKVTLQGISFVFENLNLIHGDLNMSASRFSASVQDLHNNVPLDTVSKLEILFSVTSFKIKSIEEQKLFFYLPFTNSSTYFDVNKLLRILKYRKDAEMLDKLLLDRDTILKSFVAVNFAIINIPLKRLAELYFANKPKKPSTEDQIENLTTAGSDETISRIQHLPGNTLKEKFKSSLLYKLLPKMAARFQFVKGSFKFEFSDNLSLTLKVDEFGLEYRDAKVVSHSLFKNKKPVNSLSTTMIVRNLSVVSGLKDDAITGTGRNEVFKIDRLLVWVNINLNDLSVTLAEINLNTVEVLLSELMAFKRLGEALQELRLFDLVNHSSATRNHHKLEVIEPEGNKKKSLLPSIVRKLNLSLNELKFIAAFQNPIQFYDNHDESEFNKFYRGISLLVKGFVLNIDNSLKSQKLGIQIGKIEASHVHELDASNYKFTKKYSNPFVDVETINISYCKLKNKLLVEIPIVNLEMSVKIMWNILFVKAVLSALSARPSTPKVIETSYKSNKATSRAKENLLPFNYKIHIGLVMFGINLPNNVPLALEWDCIHILPKEFGPNISFNALRLYGSNTFKTEFWSPILILTNGMIGLNTKKVVPTDPQIYLNLDSLRLEVPFEYVFYKTVDNLLTFFKTIIQLNLNMKYIMQFSELPASHKNPIKMPSVVKPLKMPKVEIKAKQFQFGMFDDTFETELNDSLLLGMLEQKIRIAKMSAFEATENSLKRELFAKYPNIEIEDGRPVNPSPENSPSSTEGGSTPTNESSSFVVSVSTNKRKGNNTSATENPGNHIFGHKNKRPGFSSALSKSAYNRFQEEYKELMRELTALEATLEISKKRLYNNMSRSWMIKSRREREERRKATKSKIVEPLVRHEFLKKFPVLVNEAPSRLFLLELTDMTWTLDVPDFGLDNYPDFIHKVGKGMPKTMTYTILAPLFLDISCSRLTVQIKDYPLPLVSFGGGDDDSDKSVNLRGNLVVAEQFHGKHELRWIFVDCADEEDAKAPSESMYSCNIPRTLTAIKFYTDLKIHVNSSRRAMVAWSTAIQPGLGYAMNSFDILSKPPLDKSPLIGFWDKFSLLVHGGFDFKFQNGLDLFIKSGTSPYLLMASNSGFVFRWSEDVNLKINPTGKSQDFLVVESKMFDVIVPKFDTSASDKFLRLTPSYKVTYTVLKKVVKLNGRPVRWKLGFLFERNMGELDDNQTVPATSYKPGRVARTSAFKNHWEIELRNPSTFENPEDAESWDSYKGYRSRYVHLAVSLDAAGDYYEREIFNSIHFTPMTTHHFFKWWSSFSSLGLPIKNGSMFKNKFLDYRRSPKFGDNLFTIKYQLLFKSLFLTHCYLHGGSGSLDPSHKVTYTGLKTFVKSFSLDLHQIAHEMTLYDKNTNRPYTDWKLKMSQGEIDLQEVDLRVLSAKFKQTCISGMLAQELGVDTNLTAAIGTSSGSENASGEYSSSALGTGAGSDSHNGASSREWLDLDDYSEIESHKADSSDIPKWSAVRLATSPRFSYFRQTPQSEEDVYAFGEEESHDCSIGTNHPEKTQERLASDRVAYIVDQIESVEVTLNSLKDSTGGKDPLVAKKIKELESQLDALNNKRHIVNLLIADLTNGHVDTNAIADDLAENRSIASEEFLSRFDSVNRSSFVSNSLALSRHTTTTSSIDMQQTSSPHSTSTFRNRFIIHNIFWTWNNELRSKLFKYLENLNIRKSSTFNLSRRAVKLSEEILKSNTRLAQDRDIDANIVNNFTYEPIGDSLDNVDDLLKDLSGYVGAIIDDTYLLKCISPQLRLISEKDPDACLIVASRDITMRTISINSNKVENNAETDIDSSMDSTMATRTSFLFDNAFVYVFEREKLMKNAYGLFYFSEEENWPPKLPIEMCYDSSSLTNAAVINGTTFALMSFNTNNLYFSSKSKVANNGEAEESSIGNVYKALFPKIDISTTSKQYSTILNVITDVIEFKGSKEEKKIEERIQKLIAISDEQDFGQLPARITQLQQCIRVLSDAKHYMFISTQKSANCLVSKEFDIVNVEIERLTLQLHYLVNITRKAKSSKFRDLFELSKWYFSTDQIMLHLLDDNYQPFVDISGTNAYYLSVKSTEGSSHNKVSIQMAQSYDLHGGCRYPEILSPLLVDAFNKNHNEDLADKICVENPAPMVVVDWKLLPPIGGIEIVEYKNISFSPLKVEVDYLTAKRIYDFVYPKAQMKSLVGDSNSEKRNTSEEDSYAFLYSDDEDDMGDDDSMLTSIFSTESSSSFLSPNSDNSHHHSKYGSKIKGFLTGHRDGNGSGPNGGLHRSSSSSSKGSTSSFTSNLMSEVPLPHSATDSPGTSVSSVTSLDHSSSTNYSNNTSKVSNDTLCAKVNNVKEKAANNKNRQAAKSVDDITEILKRSETYSLLNKITINPIKLCISFKGQGALKIVNVERLVVDVPKLEYANKTWSNEEFLLNFRKEVLRVALRHTGKFIGNKVTSHKKNRSRLSQPFSKLVDYNGYLKVGDLTKSNTEMNTRGAMTKNGKGSEDAAAHSAEGSHHHDHHHHHHHHHHHQGPEYDPDILEPSTHTPPPDHKSKDFSHLTQIAEEE